MNARILPLLTVLALLVSAPAAFAQAEPLAGEGENLEAVSHFKLYETDVQKNEIELAGDWAFVSSDMGLDIIDISNPAKPSRTGQWICEAGWGDIDLNPAATIAVLTNAHAGECLDSPTAVAIIDISNKAKPKMISSISLADAGLDYTHTAMLSQNLLFLNPQSAAFYPQSKTAVAVYDIANPAAPKFLNYLEYTGDGVAHDSYLDRRPDGKKLFYGADIHRSTVWNLDDPMKPSLLQTITNGEGTISHQLEPNHNRTIGIMVDESAVDAGLVQSGTPAACGKFGVGPAAIDVGSTQFYGLNEDGTFATINGGGATPLGTYNAAPDPGERTCTSHVFVTAPDQNRYVQAFYSQGARVVDFEDPAAPIELGSFKAEPSTIYWSAKPHRGYIFATDMERGLDILKYTGEGGAKWPATQGPYEEERSRRHDVPYKPLSGSGGGTVTGPLPQQPQGGAAERSLGRFSFRARINKKLRGHKGTKRRTLAIVFYDVESKKTVGTKLRVKKAVGKKPTVRAAGVAESGKYRWTIKLGRKTLKRGTMTVGKQSGLSLSPKAQLAGRAR